MTKTVLFNGVDTRISMDDPQPDGTYVWAAALARFVDEGSGKPILSGVRVQTDFPKLNGQASGSAGGVYGFPPEAFPFLATQNYDLTMRVETDVHLPQTVLIHVPKQTTAFDTFAPVLLGDLVLHRQGVTLTGRCLRKTTGAPMSGANVTVTKAWRVAPPPAGATPAETAALVSIWPPLPYALDDATASIRRRILTPVDSRPLALPAAAGDTQIAVTDATALAVNGILKIDGSVPDRVEYATVASLNQNVVTLKAPLIMDHRLNATVERVTAGPLGAVKSVVHGSLPGDVAMYLSDAAGLSSGDTVRIQAPGQPDSFHRVTLYVTTTDSRGMFALPPISRAGQVEITTKSLGLTVVIKILLSSQYKSKFAGDFLL